MIDIIQIENLKSEIEEKTGKPCYDDFTKIPEELIDTIYALGKIRRRSFWRNFELIDKNGHVLKTGVTKIGPYLLIHYSRQIEDDKEIICLYGLYRYGRLEVIRGYFFPEDETKG